MTSFDLAKALANTDDDPLFFRDIVATFERTHAKLLADITTNIADGPGLERAAHTLKGALLAFSAQGAADLAYSLEQRGRAGDLQGCAETLEDLRGQVEELRLELRQAVVALCGAENG